MTLVECLNRVSYREYLTWLEHFANDLNVPDRHDYYLMRIAAEIQRWEIKGHKLPPLEHFLVRFIRKGDKKPKKHHTPEEVEKKSIAARAVVMARMGMNLLRKKDG